MNGRMDGWMGEMYGGYRPTLHERANFAVGLASFPLCYLRVPIREFFERTL